MTDSPLHCGRSGSAHYYRLGCRCGECTEARRIERKKYRDWAKIMNSHSYRHQLSVARAFKKNCVGTCERCGAATRYNGHDGRRVSRFCGVCGPLIGGGMTREARIGKGHVQAKILAALSDERERRFVEIMHETGIPKNQMGPTLDSLMRSGLIERPRRGVYRAALPTGFS